jgi:hypothetical protein
MYVIHLLIKFQTLAAIFDQWEQMSEKHDKQPIRQFHNSLSLSYSGSRVRAGEATVA